MVAIDTDPILIRFRSELHKLYGSRLERAVLYGSRAGGDARPDSDYDVAVFLRDPLDRAEEMNRLADLATDILYDIGGVIHAMFYPAGGYATRALMLSMRDHDATHALP